MSAPSTIPKASTLSTTPKATIPKASTLSTIPKENARLAKINKISLVPIKINLFAPNEEFITHATGFIFRHDDKPFLVTNWHVLSGRNFETNACIDSKCRHPTHIEPVQSYTEEIRIEGEKPSGGFIPDNHTFGKLPLYSNSSSEAYCEKKPLWREHPLGRQVDIAVMPIQSLICSCGKNHKFYDAESKHLCLDDNIEPEVAMDAFILGYPDTFTGGLSNFPIWKRGSVASEPDFSPQNLPLMYVDTATRPGMSGSPVYIKGSTITFDENGSLSHWSFMPTDKTPPRAVEPFKFIGIYSGRYTGKKFEAQLGIVWKKKAIIETVCNAIIPENPILSTS